MRRVAWRDWLQREIGQLTTLVSLYLQGELGLPGPPGVPGLIVSTQIFGEGKGQEAECGEQAISPAGEVPLLPNTRRSWGTRADQSEQGAEGGKPFRVTSGASSTVSEPFSSLVKWGWGLGA